MISLTVLITSTLRTEDHRGSSIFLDKSGRFQNLQLDFHLKNLSSVQFRICNSNFYRKLESKFCAFQNLKLEFFAAKIRVAFRFKPDGFLVRVTVKPRTGPEHTGTPSGHPGIPPDGPDPPEHPKLQKWAKKLQNQKALKIHR